MKTIAVLSSLSAALVVGIMATTSASAADAYPKGPIKIIVAYPAGGGTDVIARMIGQKLSERLKQPVVVENRPGASGMIGSEAVKRSPADGYTIMYTAADTHSINPHVYSKITYDAQKDFTPIAVAGLNPFGLVVSNKVPAANVAEFVKFAKDNAGKTTYSSWGVGSSAHVASEMFAAKVGVKMRHVPYQGAAPAITGVMNGEVDSLLVPRTVAEPNHKAGKVKMIATATAERSANAPDVPTLTELGIPLVIAPWQGFLGPANMPAEVVTILNREINAAIADPTLKEALAKSGLMVGTGTPAEFKAILDKEFELWGAVIREANIKAD